MHTHKCRFEQDEGPKEREREGEREAASKNIFCVIEVCFRSNQKKQILWIGKSWHGK